MLTEQELKEALADAVEDPAAEQYTLGLSDRALAEAGEGSWWQRSMSGKRGRLMPGIAVGSAFVVAAAVGVVALGDGSGGGSGGGPQTSLAAPGTAANPAGQSALTEFGAECFNGHGPKLDLSYVWDRATQQYVGVPGDVFAIFQASPDGKQALVERGMPEMSQSWAVADWSDAVAGRLTQHPIADGYGVQWSADGKEVVSKLAWDVVKQTGGVVVRNKNADFFDPASGRFLASVPIPQQVLAMGASGQWSVQQWQGDHDSVLFPLVSNKGDRMEFLNAQGATVRTVTLQDGLPATVSIQDAEDAEQAVISPDGRYLAESSGGHVATFDLQADGKRIGVMDDPKNHFQGWTGDHEIVTAAEEEPPGGAKPDQIPPAGHSPVYSVLTPELKAVQQVKFVLPADPRGACATWPVSWAPKSQFPGAFVP